MSVQATPAQAGKTPEQSVVDVSPDVLASWLRAGDTVLVDVREDFEHATERIPGAVHVPLGSLDPEALRARCAGKRVVFHCRSGKRGRQAAERFQQGSTPAMQLGGGIEAWKAAGQQVERAAGAPRIDVMRQVQMTAGSLVLAGVLLGWLVSPWFLLLSGFIGAGLVFAGASGWCGMAMLLARMPWNRPTRCAD